MAQSKLYAEKPMHPKDQRLRPGLRPRSRVPLSNQNYMRFQISEWRCDDCNMLHTSQQSQCVLCKKPKPMPTQPSQVKLNLDHAGEGINYKAIIYENQHNIWYQEVDRILIQCNGDCGSQFAKLIEKILKEHFTSVRPDITEHKSTISIMFRYLNDPLRQSLLRLMRKRGLFNNSEYEKYYKRLNDETFYVEDTEHIMFILNLFKTLINGNQLDILQHIAFETCRDPCCSLLEQISHRKLYPLQNQYNALAQTISMFKHDITMVNKLKTKRDKIEKEIEEEKKNIKQQKNIKNYFAKLKRVKEHFKYKQMQEQNGALNDLEILAILFYCDEDDYCTALRKSHYTKEENSCRWSNLFYHICSGIDKIWRIFHYKQSNTQKYLFSGHAAHLKEDSKQQLHLKTLTSFTTNTSVAKEFANKGGMIMVIEGADIALSEGRLRGADVSWISRHIGENETLILPTTFRNFKLMTQQDMKKWWITQDYKVYITSDVESIYMSSFITNINDTFDPPMAWIPPNFPYYDDLRTTIDCAMGVLGNLAGVWRGMECPECGIHSRIFHFSGAWTDLSVQCPSCRSLVVKSGNNDNRNRLFCCYNTECKSEMISTLDLKKVNFEEHGLDPGDGYQCTYCGSQQKKAHLHHLANNDSYIDIKADAMLDRLNELLYLNCKYSDGETKSIDKSKYKDDLKRIIKYILQPENINVSLLEIMKEFPIIWKWITSIKYIKMMLDAYKDGYMDLFEDEMIDTSNDKEITTAKYTRIGSVIGDEISKIDSVHQVLNIGSNILQGMRNQNNSDSICDENDESEYDQNEDNQSHEDNENDEDDQKVYYTCQECGETKWAYKGFEGVKCMNCLANEGIKGLFSLFNKL